MSKLFDNINNLKDGVKEIQEKIGTKVKQFGTKTPSGKNPKEEDIVNPALQFIVGSLGHLLIGKKLKPQDFEKILSTSKDHTLFGMLNDWLLEPKNKKFKDRINAIRNIFLSKDTIEGLPFYEKTKKSLKVIDTTRWDAQKKLIKSLQESEFKVKGINSLIRQEDEVEEAVKKSKSKKSGKSSTININIDSTPIDLDNVQKKLQSIFGSLKNIDKELSENLQNNLVNLSSILQSINSLVSEIGGIGSADVSDKLDALNKIIGEWNDDKDKGSFKKLIENLDKLGLTLKNTKHNNIDHTLKNVFSITSDLTLTIKNLSDINIKPEDISKKIASIINILNSKDNSINALIKAINDIGIITNSNNVKQSLESLKVFLDITTSILNISTRKVLKARISLNLVRFLLVNSIKSIIDDLKDTARMADGDDVKKSFEVFDKLIDSIAKIGEIDRARRRQMRSNLLYIKNFIIADLKETITSITEFDSIAEEIENSIEIVFNLIDSLLKVGDIEESKFDQMSDNLGYLQGFVECQIPEFLQAFSTEKLFNKCDPKTITNNVESVKKIIDTFTSIFDNVGSVKFHFANLIKLNFINNEIDQITKAINALQDVRLNGLALQNIRDITIPLLKEIFDGLNDATQSLSSINTKLFDKIDDIINVVKKINALSKLSAISKISEEGMQMLSSTADIMVTIINKFKDVDEKNIEKTNKTINTLLKVVVISAAILLIGGLVMSFIKIKDIIAFTLCLSIFLFSISFTLSKFSDTLKESLKGAEGAVIIVAGAGLVLLLGGYLSQFIELKDLIKFTFMLTVFLLGIGLVFRLFHEGFENAMDGAQDAIIIVGGAALILILGSIAYKNIKFGDAFAFAAMLSLFLLFLGGIFYLVHKSFENIMEGAKDAIIIVGGAALILILGSLVIKYVNGWDAIKFALLLGAFLLIIGGIFRVFVKGFKAIKDSAKDALLLVGISAAILILGSVLWKYIDKEALWEFELALIVFVGGIVLLFGLAQMLAKGALKGAYEISILVAVSAAILLFGSWLITKKMVDQDALLAFTITLGLFIGALLWMFKSASKDIQKCFLGVLGISILTLVAGGILLYAGYLMTKHDGLGENVLLFELLLLGYVAAMSALAYILGSKVVQKNIWWGIGAMAAIVIITGLAAIVIGKIAAIGGTPHFFSNLLECLKGMGLVLLGVVGAVVALGLALQAAWPVLAIGAAGLVIIIGIVNLAASVFDRIVETMKKMSEIEEFDATYMLDNIKVFVEIADALAPIGKKFMPVYLASIVMDRLSITLSKMANVIKSWSTLKIPIYNGTKVVGYETITSDAFPKAAENIRKVVSTLGKTIIDIYDENPEMFEINFGDLFTGGSKFAKVVNSLKKLGPLLSSIASGVKSWASLRIPQYSGSKISGYITIDKDEITGAGKNIKKVIITMTQAVIEAYDERPDLFEVDEGWQGTGIGVSSKFSKVAKSLKKLGPMLSSIAYGVKTWASLRIPQYGGGVDKDGNPRITDYITLDQKEFIEAAKNIKAVIKTMVEAVIDAYDENPDLFAVDFGDLLTGGSKFSKVAKSIGKIGPMLSSIAKSLELWAELKIPVYKPNSTEVLTYIDLTDKTKLDAVAENISTVVTTLADGLIQAYNKNDSLFNEGFVTNSEFSKICKSFSKMGPMLTDMANAVQLWADLKIPVYKPNSTEIQTYVQLTDEHFKKVGDHIKYVVEALGKGIIEAYKGNPNFNLDTFEDVLEAIYPMGSFLKDMAQGIQAWADLKVPVYKKGSTEIETYVDLDDEKITTAATNIGKVVKNLVDGIGKAYNQKLFDVDFPWLGNSPIEKVIKSTTSMGNMLKTMASAISDWVELKIPVYDTGYDANGNLKVKEWIQLDNQKFTDASNHIKDVVTFFAKEIAKLYEEHEEWFKAASWTGVGKSPIARVAASIEPMGNMLKTMADAIKNWVSLKIPQYGGGLDKDGNPQITGYVTLEKDEFKKASDHIELVVKTIGETLINVVEQHPQIFKKGDNKLKKASEAIKITGDALTSIAKTLGNYASGKFQVLKLDQNGKWVGGETITLGPKLYEDLNRNVTAVTTALGNALFKVYNEHKNDGIFFTDDPNDKGKVVKSPIWIVANSIKVMAGALTNIMAVIGGIAKLKTNDIMQQLGAIGSPNTILNDFNLIINSFFTLASILGNKEYKHKYQMPGTNNIYEEHYEKGFEAFKQWMKIAPENTGAITKLQTLYNTIISSASKMFEKYNEYKTNIDQFLIKGNAENPIVTQFENVIDIYKKLINALYDIAFSRDESNDPNKQQLSVIEKLNQIGIGSETYQNNIIKLSNLSKTIFDNIKKINDASMTGANIDVDTIKKSIGNVKEVIDEFDKLMNIESNASNKLNTQTSTGNFDRLSLIKISGGFDSKHIDFDEEYKKISKKLNLITSISKETINLAKDQQQINPKTYQEIYTGISLLYKAIQKVEDISNYQLTMFQILRVNLKKCIETVKEVPSIELFKVLADGLSYIYKSTAEITNVINFKSHTDALSRYVDIVNALNINNVSTLTDFINAVNELTDNFGDLDKLTEAIGDKLSAVLCELVNQLRKADASIESAHKLQEERKKLIEASLTQVRNIMSQHMIVEISQTSTGDDASSLSGGYGGSSSSSDSSSTSSGVPSTGGFTSSDSISSGTPITSSSNDAETYGDKNRPDVNRYFNENGTTKFNKISVTEFRNLCKNIFKESVLKTNS